LNTEEYTEDLIDTQNGRYLTFTVEREVYGIKIQYVSEIVGMQPITPLPEMPEYIKGIINLRGKIVPVMDVRLKFRKNSGQYDDRTCIIVIELRGTAAGLIVDHVEEVIEILDENICAALDNRLGILDKYLDGVGKTGDAVTLLLSCEKLFLEDETGIMREVHQI
jgi:purine-binding chemotaxis protein CheW